MRWMVLALVCVPGLLGYGISRPALAQRPSTGCWRVLQSPFQSDLPALAPILLEPSSTSPDSSPFFVSSTGHLCRSFSPEVQSDIPEQSEADETGRPGKAFLLSAAVPGGGQWYLGQERWPAYLAVELWAWVQFLDRRREGHRLERQYKDLAWYVARRVSSGPRNDAGWEYYEALTKFQSSGAYDRDPEAPGVQPEVDPSTYNGFVWSLALEIYLPEDSESSVEEDSDPYQKAFDFYLSRAYAPSLAWDWGNNTLHRERYGNLIKDSDEALRSSTSMIGVILANHLLSAVDALVSGRLGIAGEAEPSVRLSLAPGPFHRTSVSLHFRLPDPLSHGH